MISTTPKMRFDDPSHHLAVLSHDNTDSNCNSTPPILLPSIAPSPACPNPSFVCGPRSSMPKVEDVSIWLRWAVDPTSALRVFLLPPLLVLPTHFLLPLLRPHLLPSLQGMGNPFTPFFLSHPTAASERLSSVVVRPELVPTTQLYLKGPGDLALLAYSSYAIPDAGAETGDTEGGEGGTVWGEGLCGCVFFGVHTLHHPASSALNASTAHFWLDYPHNHLSGPMNRIYLSQIAYWLQQALRGAPHIHLRRASGVGRVAHAAQNAEWQLTNMAKTSNKDTRLVDSKYRHTPR
ncbi:hypothetical protein B0H13DRAFT_2431666 [Mycena leptocephala]|nr:hypothetical protein B0H13DRAFT_2431666 [Mycena leptocephala]